MYNKIILKLAITRAWCERLNAASRFYCGMQSRKMNCERRFCAHFSYFSVQLIKRPITSFFTGINCICEQCRECRWGKKRGGPTMKKRGISLGNEELCVCKWRSLMDATMSDAGDWLLHRHSLLWSSLPISRDLFARLSPSRWWSASRSGTDSSWDERLACNYIEKSRASRLSLTPRSFHIEGVRACKWRLKDSCNSAAPCNHILSYLVRNLRRPCISLSGH